MAKEASRCHSFRALMIAASTTVFHKKDCEVGEIKLKSRSEADSCGWMDKWCHGRVAFATIVGDFSDIGENASDYDRSKYKRDLTGRERGALCNDVSNKLETILLLLVRLLCRVPFSKFLYFSFWSSVFIIRSGDIGARHQKSKKENKCISTER